jgi:LPPG:FO 2-phospho-L-lactate transferase
VKGPTEPFLDWLEQPLSSDGIAHIYAGIIDGLVADARTTLVPTLETDVLMSASAERVRLARDTLRFALGLARS